MDFIAISPPREEVPPISKMMRVSGPNNPWPPLATGPVYHGYFFRQDDLAQTWVIDHGLEAYPTITAQTEQGQQDSALARWVDLNHVELIFAAPTSGAASLIVETNAAGEPPPAGAA